MKEWLLHSLSFSVLFEFSSQACQCLLLILYVTRDFLTSEIIDYIFIVIFYQKAMEYILFLKRKQRRISNHTSIKKRKEQKHKIADQYVKIYKHVHSDLN